VSTTYRWTIYTDSTREAKIGAASGRGSLVFKRDSKAAAQQAMTAFYQGIKQHMPDGRNARAWLEKSDKYGPKSLVSLKLHVEKLSTSTHQWIHAWQDHYGAIVASFLYEIDPRSGLRTMRTGSLL
jgi:hypothetical protein